MTTNPEDGGDRLPDPQADLERAQERLSFYEHFDRIIQENVARASDLLREASAQTESSGTDLVAERLQYRSMIAAMLDQVQSLQGETEKLARTMGDALDDLEAKLPPSAAFPPVSDPPLLEPESVTEPLRAAVQKRSEPFKTTTVQTRTKEVRDVKVEAVRPVPDAEIVSTLLVHGVARASSALALKSYVERLEHVRTVEPREFAAGVLRLQVESNRELIFSDLQDWDLGNRLEELNAKRGLLEVRIRAG